MSVYRRSGGQRVEWEAVHGIPLPVGRKGRETYYCDLYIGKGAEQRRYRHPLGSSYREAVRAEARLRAKIASGDYGFLAPPAKTIATADFCRLYLEKYSAVEKSAGTVERDRVILAHFADYFGTRPLGDITPEDMAGYVRHRLNSDAMDPNRNKRKKGGASKVGRSVGASTVNRELGCVGNLFKVARRWKYITGNPMDGVKKLRVNDIQERYLSPEEAHRLVSAARDSQTPGLAAFITLALSTGMRRGELLNLRWDQFDFAAREVVVVQEKTGYKKSIPLGAPALEALRDLMRERAHKHKPEASPYLFKNDETGEPYRHINKAFKNALKRAGITRPFAVKDLRHTAATWLRQKGVDIAAIRDILGHRSIVTTMRYAHIGREDLARAVQKLDTIWTQGPERDTSADSGEAASSGNS